MLFLAGEDQGRCEKAKRTRRYPPMGRHVPASRHWFVCRRKETAALISQNRR